MAFAHPGSVLVLVARNAERLEGVAREILRSTQSVTIATLPLDLTHPDALARLDATLAANGVYADILINNAGIGLAGRFVSHAPEQLDALIDLNIAALTRWSRHVLPGQLVRGRGGIINIASLGGYIPAPQQAAYYASKAYVLSLSEAIAAETAGRGVHVLAVAPGPVNTEFHSKMGARSALYRRLIPSHSARQVAVGTRIAFLLGVRVLVPGPISLLTSAALRLLPHRFTLPVVAMLLRPQSGPVMDPLAPVPPKF